MPQILTIIIKGGIVMIPLLACSLTFARAEHRAHPVLDPAEVKSRD
jgi:hypothetical protein